MLKSHSIESFSKKSWSCGTIDRQFIIEEMECGIGEECTIPQDHSNNSRKPIQRLFQAILLTLINDCINPSHVDGSIFKKKAITDNSCALLLSGDPWIREIFESAGFNPERYIPLAVSYIDNKRNQLCGS